MSKTIDGLLTIADLCDRLHVSRNTAYRLLATQVIPAFKVGRSWRIPVSSMEEFIADQLNDKKEENHHV
ncbi:helix-turn-helix domain-containing protein [Candidatus Saccharibacteria bacterium]|nr:helix-turn-helix domain-containing protein [Candidatus Saccharibacteria bacterium]